MAMKNLEDVLEKLKIDDIVIDKEFPIDGTLDDMVKFLKHEGFEEIKMSATWNNIQKDFLKASHPVFTKFIQNTYGVIAIYDGTNNTQKDLFIIVNDSDHRRKYYIFYNLDSEMFTMIGEAEKVEKKKFLKELSNIFQ